MAQAIANKFNIMKVCSSENDGQTIANNFNMRVCTVDKLTDNGFINCTGS